MSNPTEIALARCAVPSPLRRLLDYVLPPGCGSLIPGQRVLVPLGQRHVVAVVVSVASESDVPRDKLKSIDKIIDESSLIQPDLFELLRWVAAYYIHPVGEVLPLGLSPRERRGEPSAPTGVASIKLTLRGRGLPEGALKRAPRQGELLSLLQRGTIDQATLDAKGISRAIVRELVRKGLAEHCQVAPEARWTCNPPLPANTEQKAAIDAISESLGTFTCHLLHGITGSGKTEVYLQAIAETLAKRQQVLVLLPEIALTPQMLERFRARFNAPVLELHSGLADGERDRNWAAARNGEAAVIVGTRSAVFVPLATPGLIIVDEEHETTFTQQDGLRYSGRDVAIKRAQLSGCPVVLGSATPSLETIDNAHRGRYRLSKLNHRTGTAAVPARELLDIRALDLRAGLSPHLLEMMTATLAAGEQALLLLNRRGFAPALTCHDCGWVSDCSHCDARMTIHRHPARLLCHHCGHQTSLPACCPSCGSRRLAASGIGTQQTEAALRELFAGYPVHRVDSDSVRTRQDMAALRKELAQNKAAVLIGTQMLAKGHDFPRVTLVGVVDADGLLFSSDYRGEERLLQLLTQVSGRAGRGNLPGRVVIQTRHPEHPLMREVVAADYDRQMFRLLNDRYQRGLPPAGALALLRADSRAVADGLRFLEKVGAGTEASALADCRVVGPLAAPMARRAGWSRTQLIISGKDRASVGAAMRHLVGIAEQQKTGSGLRWFVDIDPVDAI